MFVLSCSSSTFKDPERASLRDSGHGDSDQADSDQDTNKGSCCDMSAKEALKLKASGVKPPPLEQGEPLPGNLTRNKQKKNCLGKLFALVVEFYSLLKIGAPFVLFFPRTLFFALFSFKVNMMCVLVCALGGVTACIFYTRLQFIKADKPIMFL